MAIGMTLAVNPELVSNKPVPDDIFKAVARRVWWGLIIGMGIVPFLIASYHPGFLQW